jgi:hypothetical protein
LPTSMPAGSSPLVSRLMADVKAKKLGPESARRTAGNLRLPRDTVLGAYFSSCFLDTLHDTSQKGGCDEVPLPRISCRPNISKLGRWLLLSANFKCRRASHFVFVFCFCFCFFVSAEQTRDSDIKGGSSARGAAPFFWSSRCQNLILKASV